MEKTIITSDRFYSTVEVDMDLFRCTKCEDASINRGDNYCRNCGAKIEWRLK